MTFTRWRLTKNTMTSSKKRAAKENAKEAAKPEEEAVNERKEDFVSLDDMLDPEHDPQINCTVSRVSKWYARDLVEHVLCGDFRMEHRGCGE
ncbi:hypothetical protein HID58_013647 [Brassica napus]|uniref:Uncharacterized protein n=1 Tax=Brassica napus TaxID=3708 RepID=A0ABQ8E4H8_BRANA|nr:hypothetical protein HID58_013647 [Brassica napus]